MENVCWKDIIVTEYKVQIIDYLAVSLFCREVWSIVTSSCVVPSLISGFFPPLTLPRRLRHGLMSLPLAQNLIEERTSDVILQTNSSSLSKRLLLLDI
jgi:hypothetical protein